MTLTGFKEKAGKKFTNTQREEPNAPAVSLKDWNGLSPYAGGPTATATVTYHLEGTASGKCNAVAPAGWQSGGTSHFSNSSSGHSPTEHVVARLLKSRILP